VIGRGINAHAEMKGAARKLDPARNRCLLFVHYWTYHLSISFDREQPMNWRDYIASDPEILAGRPTVKGMRLSVDLILDRLADGWTAEDLFQAYPRLTSEALQAAFAFAAEILKDEDYIAIAKAAA
jgi:uncharacterized protein (DUF433 family)